MSEQKWYIQEKKKNIKPEPRQEGSWFFMPYNINFNPETEEYCYCEFALSTPVTYETPIGFMDIMVNEMLKQRNEMASFVSFYRKTLDKN